MGCLLAISATQLVAQGDKLAPAPLEICVAVVECGARGNDRHSRALFSSPGVTIFSPNIGEVLEISIRETSDAIFAQLASDKRRLPYELSARQASLKKRHDYPFKVLVDITYYTKIIILVNKPHGCMLLAHELI